jgi:adenosylcobinamide-GDP ribazoletransferase
MSGAEFLIAAVSAALPALAVVALHWLPANALIAGVIAASMTTLWLARKFVRRIGGYTGDCLGAVQQVSEVMFYLCALASLQP